MKTVSARGLVAAALCGAAPVSHNLLTGPAGPRGPANSLFPNARLQEDADAWRAWGAQNHRAQAEPAAGASTRVQRRNRAEREPDVMESFSEAIDAGDLLTPELVRRVSLRGAQSGQSDRRPGSRLPGRKVTPIRPSPARALKVPVG